MRLAPGTTLGKYRIEHVVRETSLRVIHRATNIEGGAPVAVHTIAGNEHDAFAVHGLMAESVICKRLQGPHSPRAIDVGLERDIQFLVTEPLDGWWLADAIADREHLHEGEAVRWLSEALDALRELHALGVVHRDVKPGNMIVVGGGQGRERLLLCGYGLALRLDEKTPVTDQGIIGTPAYTAPEQIRSPKVDARADVWSWGVSLYEALSGKLPFMEDDPPALAAAIMGKPHPPLTGVSDALARIVDRCLAKHPNARFQSVVELRDALRPLQPS